MLNYVNNMPNSIGYIDWAYLQNNLQSATNVVVIPVVNAQNGLSQTPTTQSIQAEIINMNNKNYDSSLCRQLYYITNGQPDSLVSNYINWAMSPLSTPAFNSLGLYSATDLGLPTNTVTTTVASMQTRTITDFAGNVLTIPANLTRIVSTQPIPTFMIWAVVPRICWTLIASSMAGWLITIRVLSTI